MGRHGSPLKRNKFCSGEARGPSRCLHKSNCFMGGMRTDVGDGLAPIAGVTSPPDVLSAFRDLPRASNLELGAAGASLFNLLSSLFLSNQDQLLRRASEEFYYRDAAGTVLLSDFPSTPSSGAPVWAGGLQEGGTF